MSCSSRYVRSSAAGPRAAAYAGRFRQRAFAPGTASQRGHSLRARALLEVTSDTFEDEVVKSDKPVVIDFWASWCGPCKLIEPLVTKLQEDNPETLKVVKIECDANPDIVEKYEVYGLPSLLLFKDGEAVQGSKHEGAIAMPGIRNWLESNGVDAQ